MTNKGSADTTLDGVAYEGGNGTRSAYGIAELNGLPVLSMTNSLGVVSANASGIVGSADRTLVVLGRAMPNTYKKADDV